MSSFNASPAASVSSASAAAELLRRRAARRHLLDFTTYTLERYRPEPVHRLIADTLMDVVQGRVDRLIVVAPPQVGKSELVSVRLPAYWLGCNPNSPIILSSYAASLALKKAASVRDVVNSQEYARLFPGTRLQQNSRAREFWRIAKSESYMLAAGVGGAITGHGAMLGIIDDPFQSWAEAQSQTMRDKVWDWWLGTFATRIWEGGAVVVIMTRWHDDDLVGRLLRHEPGRWRLLRLPMIAETQDDRDEAARAVYQTAGQPDPLGREPGEVLSPERFSPEYVQDIVNRTGGIGSMVFSAEYQGSPRKAGGNIIRRAWLTIVGAAPAKARRVRYWDKAGTQGGGDYTAGVLMAEHEGTYYIEDVVRGQWSARERQAVILQTAIMDAARYGKLEWGRAEGDDEPRPDIGADPFVVRRWINIIQPGPRIELEQEGGSGGKDSATADKLLLAGFDVHTQTVQGDKLTRGMPFAAQAEAGNVRLVEGAWNAAYINELTTFPAAAHDDQWDATAGAFSRLARPATIRLNVAQV